MSEPDFHDLFNAVPANIMIVEARPPAFLVRAATDAFLAAVARTREQVIDKPVYEALPLGDADQGARVQTFASWQRVIDTRAPDAMAIERHDMRTPDGALDVRYWTPTNYPILDGEGRVSHILLMSEDVTNLVLLRQSEAVSSDDLDALREAERTREINAQLRAANEQLAELDRLKTAFLANVSHELRTPLTLILGALDGLSGDPERLGLARRNALRLLDLIGSLLDFAQVEAGRKTARFEPVDLCALTRDLASGFRSLAEQAGVDFEVRCPSRPEPAFVDRGMWERIVTNLLSNAFKYTPSGRIEVRLDESDDAWRLAVTDTGVGVPEAERERIFDRFHRVPGAGGRSHEGSGLGLALVRELAKAHGGEVHLDSEEGRGSTFTVRVPSGQAHLPAAQVAAEPAEPPRASPALEASTAQAEAWLPTVEPGFEPAAGQDAVLVVDDNADMRRYLSALLGPRVAVAVAADGVEALARARRRPPDLILTDIMMPRMSGLELLRAVRADPHLAKVPVVLLSARAGEAAVVEGLDAGADDYIAKPFSAAELWARVKTHLELSRLRRDVGRERAAVEARDEFLALAAHELRTPVAALVLEREAIAVASQGDLDAKTLDKVRLLLDRTATQIDRIDHLVERLLDTSRIAAGRFVVDRAPADLAKIARAVAARLAGAAEAAGCPLRLHAPEPVEGDFDASRLDQVLTNLLVNAFEYAAGAPVEIRVEAAGDAAWLTVSDRGPGIPEDSRDRVFERHERAADHRHSGGLGLGLYLARYIVAAHGGELRLEAAEGAGCTFVAELPRRA